MALISKGLGVNNPFFLIVYIDYQGVRPLKPRIFVNNEPFFYCLHWLSGTCILKKGQNFIVYIGYQALRPSKKLGPLLFTTDYQ